MPAPRSQPGRRGAYQPPGSHPVAASTAACAKPDRDLTAAQAANRDLTTQLHHRHRPRLRATAYITFGTPCPRASGRTGASAACSPGRHGGEQREPAAQAGHVRVWGARHGGVFRVAGQHPGGGGDQPAQADGAQARRRPLRSRRAPADPPEVPRIWSCSRVAIRRGSRTCPVESPRAGVRSTLPGRPGPACTAAPERPFLARAGPTVNQCTTR